MKKRLSVLLITMLLSVFVCFEAFADMKWIQYSLPELGIEVMFPSECIVLTRSLPNDAPALAALSVTAEDIEQKLIEQNFNLFASPEDFTYSFSIEGILPFTHVPDFSQLDEKSIVEKLKKQKSPEDEGITEEEYSVYRSGNMTYGVIEVKMVDGSPGHLIYETTHNNQYILITFFPKSTITDTDRKFVESIIRKIDFTNIP